MEYLEQFNNLAHGNLTAFYYGTCGDDELTEGMDLFTKILEVFLDPSSNVDLSTLESEMFLKSSLPTWIEILLKRRSKREHEFVIFKALKLTIRLLALPASLDITELCMLRNMLLFGLISSSLHFIKPNQIDDFRVNNYNFLSYYAQFGKPTSAIIGGSSVVFWPDEWKVHLQGNNAIGHCIKYFNNLTKVWIEGIITAYDKEKDLYILDGKRLMLGFTDDNFEECPPNTTYKVDLNEGIFEWMDSFNQQKYRVSSPSQTLKYTSSDVGKFIRIWWSRYNRFYYGRVSAYDSSARFHTVVYEDADSRAYDMTSKEYEVIDPPKDIIDSISALPDPLAAKFVADWHKKQLEVNVKPSTDTVTNNYVVSSQMKRDDVASQNSAFVYRPLPTTSSTLSMHQMTLINDFMTENGFENMISILLDSSIAPPIMKNLLLHVQFVAQMRGWISAKKFRETVWEIKESVVYSLTRYEEAQVNDMEFRDFDDLVSKLKEIVIIVSTESKEPVNRRVELQDSIEYLRLMMANKLLSSSKLKRRFQGLTMIKDYIDFLTPRISQYLDQRYSTLRVEKNNTNMLVPGNNSTSRLESTLLKFDRWIEGQSTLIESLYGESLHQDLILKADTLLVYMAGRRTLSERTLNLIWHASKGAHEAVVRVIHQQLLVILPALDASLRQYLFTLLSSLPRKDYTEQVILFIQSFTVHCLSATRDEQTTREFLNIPPHQFEGNDNQSLVNHATVPASKKSFSSVSNRKGQVVNAPDRPWLGFGLLWQFVQEPSPNRTIPVNDNDEKNNVHTNSHSFTPDPTLVMLAIKLLVELLNTEFVDERDAVMVRCIENIQLGVSVAVSLHLLRKILSLYPASSKSWFIMRQTPLKGVTINQQIDKLVKNYKLLEVVFAELEKYHDMIIERKNGTEKLSLVAVSSSSNAVQGIDVIGERLEFLRFILSTSCFRLTENQAKIIWKVFGEHASSDTALDKLCNWLDGLLSKECKLMNHMISFLQNEIDPIFPDSGRRFSFLRDERSTSNNQDTEESQGVMMDETVIAAVFEDCVLPWAFNTQRIVALNRPAVASLVFKIFLAVNINRKAIKVDLNEGNTWLRCNALVGLPIIWRIVLDSTNEDVALFASKLLIELHHRVPSMLKTNIPNNANRAVNGVNNSGTETFKGQFLRRCFSQLLLVVHTVANESAVEDNRVKVTRVQDKDWFEDETAQHDKITLNRRLKRLVSIIKAFAYRFYYTPSYSITLKILTNSDNNVLMTLNLNSNEKIQQVKTRVAQFFKENINALQFAVVCSPQGQEVRIDREDATMSTLKFRPLEIIQVRKTVVTTSPPVNNATTNNTTSNNNTSANDKSDFTAGNDSITQKDLEDDLLHVINPFDWLKDFGSNSTQQRSQGIFNAKDYPLQSGMSTLSNRTDLVSFENIDTALEQLHASLGSVPQLVDRLIDLLDVHIANENVDSFEVEKQRQDQLSAMIWDTIQMLPFHQSLFEEVQGLVVSETECLKLRSLLDLNAPYRTLYVLQIIDALVSAVHPSMRKKLTESRLTLKGSLDWPVQFYHVGGLELMLSLLQETVTRLKEGEGKESIAKNIAIQPYLEENQLPRNEVMTMIATMLTRIIHGELLLDPLYSLWQSKPFQFDKSNPDYLTSSTTSVGDIEVTVKRIRDESNLIDSLTTDRIPSGVLIAAVDIRKILNTLLGAINVILKPAQVLSNTMQSIPSWASNTFVENSLMLMFALLTAHEDSVFIAEELNFFQRILTTLVEDCMNSSVQSAAMYSVFECAANLLLKCADPSELLQTRKKPRMRLFDSLVESILQSTTKALQEKPTHRMGMRNTVQLITLLSAVDTLRVIPETVFRDHPTFAHAVTHFDQSSSILSATFSDVDTGIRAEKNNSESNHDRKEISRMVVMKLRWFCESKLSEDHESAVASIARFLLVLVRSDENLCAYIGRLTIGIDDEANSDEKEIDLIAFLYEQCLSSGEHTQHTTICQSVECRRVLYALLYSLCEKNIQNLGRLVELVRQRQPLPSQQSASVMELFQSKENMKRYLFQWDYDPYSLLRSKEDYIGLCNQGGTCYMNAFLQQLFHLPNFADKLLSIGEYSSEKEYENVLFQMQVMFAYLKMSQKRYFDTLPFCQSIIDYDGQPISLSEQKDINEFAGMLFDKLEKNERCRQLLAQSLQGKFVYKTKSLESAYRSDREEEFYMITVEVKDKRTLENSLELAVAEELFTGDNKIEDGETGKKVDAVRRCAIRALPETLIIHLKRFEFDLETLNRKKVNDYLSFPMDLNMYPYTEEGLAHAAGTTSNAQRAANDQKSDDDELENVTRSLPSDLESGSNFEDQCQYSLRGVVAHVGAIDRGHYFSFIKDKRTGGWLEFNDRQVLPFSADLIPRECFGGPEDPAPSNTNNSSNNSNPNAGKTNTPVRFRESNAYLLIYERAPVNEMNTQRLSPAQSPFGGAMNSHQLTVSRPRAVMNLNSETSLGVTQRVVDTLRQENLGFQRDLQWFEKTHVLFFHKLLESTVIQKSLAASNDNTSEAVEGWLVITVRFLVEVLSRARARSCIPVFITRILDLLRQSSKQGSAARYLLLELVQFRDESRSANEKKSSTGDFYAEFLHEHDRQIHPWIVTLFRHCPYNDVTQSFSELLNQLLEITASHFREELPYVVAYLQEKSLQSQDWLTACTTASSTAQSEISKTLSLVYAFSQLIDKLLLMLETFTIEEISKRDGFKIISQLLLRCAQRGKEELYIFLQLATIPRIVNIFSSIQQAINQIPLQQLLPCIELVSELVRKSEVSQNPSTDSMKATSPALTLSLCSNDLQAFLSKTFLQDAISLSSSEMSSSLTHLCWFLSTDTINRILEFLMDRIMDLTSISNATSLLYRPYFKVLSELLLGPLLQDIQEQLLTLSKLGNKAYTLSGRRGTNDLEFVYAVSKLFHRLGTASKAGFSTVMKIRDLWSDLANKIVATSASNHSTTTNTGNGHYHLSTGTSSSAGFSSNTNIIANGLKKMQSTITGTAPNQYNYPQG